jgi:hypothetical protein
LWQRVCFLPLCLWLCVDYCFMCVGCWWRHSSLRISSRRYFEAKCIRELGRCCQNLWHAVNSSKRSQTWALELNSRAVYEWIFRCFLFHASTYSGASVGRSALQVVPTPSVLSSHCGAVVWKRSVYWLAQWRMVYELKSVSRLIKWNLHCVSYFRFGCRNIMSDAFSRCSTAVPQT